MQLVSIAEAPRILGVTPDEIRNRIRKGELQSGRFSTPQEIGMGVVLPDAAGPAQPVDPSPAPPPPPPEPPLFAQNPGVAAPPPAAAAPAPPSEAPAFQGFMSPEGPLSGASSSIRARRHPRVRDRPSRHRRRRWPRT